MTLHRPSSLPLAPLTELIIEGFHDCVHELGCGFGEHVCQKALAIVLAGKGLLIESSVSLDVHFRGHLLGTFTTDLVVERLVIIEVKATSKLEDAGRAQLLNYLKCAGGGVGFLANFGLKPEIKRLVMGDPTNSLPRLSKDPVRNIERWTGKPSLSSASRVEPR